MTPRISSLALMLALLAPACGDDKGETSQTTTSSDGTTGGSTTATTSGPGTTDGTATDGSGPTSGDPDPAIKEDCVAANAAHLASWTKECACLVEGGDYPDVETCLEVVRLDPASQMVAACFCDVSARDPSSADVEECRRKEAEAYLACITPLTCADDAGHLDCLDFSPCGSNSKQTLVQVALECLGEKPVMCGSGETIPESWLCNDESDCMDGSDEKNC